MAGPLVVTNGGHADSYVVSTMASAKLCWTGDFSCLIVDSATERMEWLAQLRARRGPERQPG